MEKTPRGFAIHSFEDIYGQKCSIQKSSSACQDNIWFGIDNTGPHMVDINDKKNSSINARMHLSQKEVKELLPLLQHFAETGELAYPEPKEELVVVAGRSGLGISLYNKLLEMVKYNEITKQTLSLVWNKYVNEEFNDPFKYIEENGLRNMINSLRPIYELVKENPGITISDVMIKTSGKYSPMVVSNIIEEVNNI
jgi:hypothetical protein